MLLDSSPILLIPDNLYMAAATDGVILVVPLRHHAPARPPAHQEIIEQVGHADPGRRPEPATREPLKVPTSTTSYYRAYAKADTQA